jgi:hypothetical protein
MHEKENSGVVHSFLKAYTGLMDSLHRFDVPKSAEHYKFWQMGHRAAPFTSDPVIYPNNTLSEDHYDLR